MRFFASLCFVVLSLGLTALLWLEAPAHRGVPPPEALRRRNPVATHMMALRKAEAKAKKRRYVIVHRWVPLSRISRTLQRTVLAAEDGRFYGHAGVEWELMQKAFQDNWRAGRPVRGASTITQQLAKNLYLAPRKSYLRKVRELYLAWRLERALSKRRILEIYLNVAEWGEGIFGVEAAAQIYFGKPAADLDEEESVALAAVLPSPRRHSPVDDSRWTEKRKGWVRQQLRITEKGGAPLD